MNEPTPGALHLFHPCAITFHCPVFREISLAIALCFFSPPVLSFLFLFLFFFFDFLSILSYSTFASSSICGISCIAPNRHLISPTSSSSSSSSLGRRHHPPPPLLPPSCPLIGIITPVYCVAYARAVQLRNTFFEQKTSNSPGLFNNNTTEK